MPAFATVHCAGNRLWKTALWKTAPACGAGRRQREACRSGPAIAGGVKGECDAGRADDGRSIGRADHDPGAKMPAHTR